MAARRPKRPDPFEAFFRRQDARMRETDGFVPMTAAAYRVLLDRHEAYSLPVPD